MKRFTKLLGLGAIILALNGCEGEPRVPNYSNGYSSKQTTNPISEKTSTLEGRIVNVSKGSIPFKKGDYSDTNANHEFEYVTVFSPIDGRHHILIYPYSKEFLEKYANIEFRPLENGEIYYETFIDAFLGKNYDGFVNMPLEAEGIITKNGVKYLE